MIGKLGFFFFFSRFCLVCNYGVVVFITSLGGLYTLRWHFGVLLHSVLELLAKSAFGMIFKDIHQDI
ncbi:hypothetical protein BDV41DRAFT_173270 [Aspergillus transmontanensis]|uniref:Uncharacterized protein n=1 Tax=Aspergillus transmontanensis TaxID=1034304 RepID=A0A5N6WGB9_9EURO|nr:hypothetical protein BDV41DRAFT_173270 [Aspergillus transmontanensis]